MLMLYDFKCEQCSKVREVLVDNKLLDTVACPDCKVSMVRVISPIRSILEGHSGHFPDAADRWTRRHEKEGRKPSDTNPHGW